MSRHVIERLGHLGDGIAPGPVYVPRALPGEEVEGDEAAGRCVSPRILRPSPERVRAPCRHHAICGGCALQHASDAFVAGWKTGVIAEALRAQGLETELRPIATSPPASRRRVVFAARRGKAGAQIGFHAPRSEAMADMPDCLLISAAIRAGLPDLRQIVSLGAARKGALKLHVTEMIGGLDVAVTGGKPAEGMLAAELAQAALGSGRIARLSWNGEVMAQAQAPEVAFGKARVALPPGAFLQATPQGEQALVAAMGEAVGEASRIVDLFAGAGTFSFPAAETAEIMAVEGEAPLVRALEVAARHAQGLKPVSAQRRDLFRNPLLADELDRFEAAIIDPPRAGASAQIAEIARASLPRVAMISCNPVTFARDAATLDRAGFSLDWVQPVDQFRWSAHVELAAQMTRR